MFTGQAVLEKRYALSEWGTESDATYAVRHLARFSPGTPNVQVVEALRAVFAGPPVHGGTLVIDHTRVGRAVFESVRFAHLGVELRS